MKNSKKTADLIKTAIIALLFIMTLSLVFCHFIALRQENENAAASENLNLNLKNFEGSEQNGIKKSDLLPATIAVKKEAGSISALSHGSGYIKEVYSLLDTNIEFMLSSSCNSLTDEDPEAFDKALSRNKYIYIKYHKPIPAVLAYIHAKNSGDEDISETIGAKTGQLCISELLIFPDSIENNSLFAMAKAAEGETVSFRVAVIPDTKLIKTSDFDIYREADIMTDAAFFGRKNNSSVAPSTLIYNSSQSNYKLEFKRGTAGLSLNTQLQSELAKSLGINPDKTGSYFDQVIKGTVFMATHGTLTVCDNSIIYSTSGNIGGGIELSIFSGKSQEHNHSLSQCLAIAESLAENLKLIDESSILGREAEILITNLHRNDDNIVLEYGYFYENIPIANYTTALRIEMSSKKLTRLELFPCSATSNKADKQKSISPGWVLNIMQNNPDVNGLYTLVYKYKETESGIFEAEWIPSKIKS